MTKGIVTCNLYKRKGSPSVNAPKLGYFASGDEIEIEDVVLGETEHDYYEGVATWYKLPGEVYVWSGGVNVDREKWKKRKELQIQIELENSSKKLEFEEHWWIKDFGIDKLWKAGYSGKGVKICVLDSGLHRYHKAINVKDEYVHDVTPNSSDGDDIDGHGTHCSGIIIANNNNEVRGIARGCEFYGVKVKDDYEGDGNINTWIAGLRLAIEKNVDIISFSRGKQINYPAFKEEIQNAVEAGILVLAAAGNNGQNRTHSSIDYPARYEGVFSVGAIDVNNTPIESTIDTASTHIFAPGYRIKSVYLNHEYEFLSGSSQAAPFVAGVMALVLERMRGENPNLSSIEAFRSVLKDSTYSNLHDIRIINIPKP